MKKSLSMLLVLTILLFSGCQLGPGKAYETQSPYVQIFQCYNEHFAVRNYYLTTNPNCDIRGDVRHSEIGYLYTAEGPGMELITQCFRTMRHTSKYSSAFRKNQKHTFTDHFIELGKDCPSGTFKQKELGYAPKQPIPGYTEKAYRCWLDDFDKEMWDHWVSFDEKCFSERIHAFTKTELSFNVIKKIPVEITSMTCDKDMEENKNLKKEITTLQDEIADIKRELETR